MSPVGGVLQLEMCHLLWRADVIFLLQQLTIMMHDGLQVMGWYVYVLLGVCVVSAWYCVVAKWYLPCLCLVVGIHRLWQ
jgi:hypothetical protein